MAKFTRRDFGKLSAGGFASAGLAGSATVAAATPAAAAISGITARPAEVAQARGRRVIVVGGGWSGLTLAKYLKMGDPELDVVLIERRSVFISHPISGLWLAGLTPLETIAHSYLDAAAHNGYTYFNASLVDVDRPAHRVTTDQGWLAYDALVLAPGIDYDYASFGVTDPHQIDLLKSHYPAGFVSGSEHITLARKVQGFKGGVFVLTAPPGIYRCSATPYERACLIASVFKKRNIKGKVVLIDPRDQPAVSAEGFLAAFDELYGDFIDYMPSTEIEGIDGENRTISTGFDDIAFDDGAIYPRIRGARLLEYLGLADAKSAQREAAIDPFTYNAMPGGTIDPDVYICGDCRPMPFSKSGGTARSEAMYVAALIVARAGGKEIPWQSPHTICYSMVNTEPPEAIMVDGQYRFDTTAGQWAHFENTANNQRDSAMGKKAFEWADAHFRDMFS